MDQTKTTHWVFNPKQISALTSATRQRIMDRIEANGTMSVRQLAASLGFAADALYYHIRVLLKAELVRCVGTQHRPRRDEAIYEVINPNWQIGYALHDPKNVKAIRDVARSMMKQAYRDFEQGCEHPSANPSGPTRNLWTLRLEAHLTDANLAEIQQHLQSIFKILRQGANQLQAPLHAVSWAMAPIHDDQA